MIFIGFPPRAGNRASFMPWLLGVSGGGVIHSWTWYRNWGG